VIRRTTRRKKNKQVKNVTSRGDRHSAASSTNVNTMIKSKRTEQRILYNELVKQMNPKTDDDTTDGE